MSLSKQLYIIISLIFLVIFTGNFIITINTTKAYLEEESITKAQDTATTLGMILKKYIHQKDDPEIALTIKAIADSGFYKEIRLDNAHYQLTKEQLLAKNNIEDMSGELNNLKIDPTIGEIYKNKDLDLQNELNTLENLDDVVSEETIMESYIVEFNKEDSSYKNIEVFFDYNYNNKIESLSSKFDVNKLIYLASRPEKFDNVPQWFISFVELDIVSKNSEISDGWKTSAIVSVTPNAGIAYEKLYQQVKSSSIYSLSALILALVLLAIFLKYILIPLKRIEILANKISNGNFEEIEQIPWTTELKSVSLSMNTMSAKIKNIIHKLNNSIEDITKKLSQDSLTKLELKQSFESDIKELFISKKSGYVYIVRVANLTQFANTSGRNSVNDFLIEFAQILRSVQKGKGYRFFGSEFALIVPDVTYDEANNIAIELKGKYELLAQKVQRDDIVHIGGAPFDQFSTLGSILSGGSEAYEMAKQIGPNEIFVKESNGNSRGMLEWKNIVFDIVDNSKFNMKYIGDIIDVKTKEIVVKEAFANIADGYDEDIPIGIFISVAQEHDKIIDFDKKVILKILEDIKINNISHQISINISFDSVLDVNFVDWLKNIISLNKEHAHKLVFSLTSYSIASHIEECIKFRYLVKSLGCHLMIKRYETKFVAVNKLKDIKPDCLRLARDYTQSICHDSNKLSLVDSICKISSLLDIKVYAESVSEDNDFEKVLSLEIDGLSR